MCGKLAANSKSMRPSTGLLLFITFLALVGMLLAKAQHTSIAAKADGEAELQRVVEQLGLTDLCIATDARYLRHLSISDSVAPFMDYPGALEYFPSSSVVIPAK